MKINPFDMNISCTNFGSYTSIFYTSHLILNRMNNMPLRGNNISVLISYRENELRIIFDHYKLQCSRI